MATVILLATSFQSACAAKIDTPTFENGIFLTAENDSPIQPRVVAPVDNGGIIVAGSVGAARQAWATKIDSRNRVVWTHLRNLDEEKGTVVGTSPEYRGAIPVADGGVLLFGNMSRPTGSKSPTMMYTRLNAKGEVIAQDFLKPKDAESALYRYLIAGSVSFEDGFVIAAVEQRFPRPGDLESGPQASYLLMKISLSGAIEWERRIPTIARNFLPYTEGISLAASSDTLFLLATDNVNTEAFSVDKKGKLIASRPISARQTLVKQSEMNGTFKILGSDNNIQPPHRLITLDRELKELERIQGSVPADFVSRQIFQETDKSVVFFGSNVHWIGERYSAGAYVANRLLKKGTSVVFPNEGIRDDGQLYAASPTGTPGKYVVVRTFYRDHKSSSTANDNKGTNQHGAVVNFVNLDAGTTNAN